jgi:hypothetical protein
MIREPANLPICCSLLLLRLLHLLHPPLQQMAAAGRHINLLTSLPQNKKPQEEQEQEEKHTNIPLLTYCINRKIFNKDEEQIQRRNGRRKKSSSSSPPSPLLRNQSKGRERDPGERG